MTKLHLTIVALGASLCLPSWAADEAAEQKVSLATVPPAVAKSLKQHAGDAKITNVSKEKEGEKTVYEGTFKAKGRVHDLTVDEKGKLVSDEETIPVSEAPPAIRAAIEREFPGAKIEKLERIKEGRKTSYEALLSGKNRREEIKFSADGKVLEREDKRGDNDRD